VLTVALLDTRLAFALELNLDDSGVLINRAGGYYCPRYLVPAMENFALSNVIDLDVERHKG